MPKWLQYYIGGGMPKWLQYYIGGGGPLGTPKSDYVICARSHIAGKREGGIEANFAKIYRIIELYILGASGSDSLISLQAPQWNLSQLSYSSKFLGW